MDIFERYDYRNKLLMKFDKGVKLPSYQIPDLMISGDSDDSENTILIKSSLFVKFPDKGNKIQYQSFSNKSDTFGKWIEIDIDEFIAAFNENPSQFYNEDEINPIINDLDYFISEAKFGSEQYFRLWNYNVVTIVDDKFDINGMLYTKDELISHVYEVSKDYRSYNLLLEVSPESFFKQYNVNDFYVDNLKNIHKIFMNGEHVVFVLSIKSFNGTISRFRAVTYRHRVFNDDGIEYILDDLLLTNTRTYINQFERFKDYLPDEFVRLYEKAADKCLTMKDYDSFVFKTKYGYSAFHLSLYAILREYDYLEEILDECIADSEF